VPSNHSTGTDMTFIRGPLNSQSGARDELFGHPRALAYLFTT